MLPAWWPGTHTLVWQQHGGESPPPSSKPTRVRPQGCKQGPQPGSVGGTQHSPSSRDLVPAAKQRWLSPGGLTARGRVSRGKIPS